MHFSKNDDFSFKIVSILTSLKQMKTQTAWTTLPFNIEIYYESLTIMPYWEDSN